MSMMADYIRKEDAVDAAKHAWAKGLEPSQYIESLEPADVAPVRRGKWIDSGSLSCRCDQCGCKNTKETPFCPFCGAKMDGGKS